MTARALSVTDTQDLREKVPDVVVAGDPGAWVLVCKASSQEQGWMKTTKRLRVTLGHIYQMETQQRNTDGSWSLSQSSVFVPSQ